MPHCLNCEDRLEDSPFEPAPVWRGKLGPYCSEFCADVDEEFRREDNK